MARQGVSYQAVKQAALKLLSQGLSPSVQKIRQTLGTGSHTTIAEHLKHWREEHAARKVHHLPSTIPEDLVSAMEILWQTALEQANQQLASFKTELEEQEKKWQLDRISIEKDSLALQASLKEAHVSLDEKARTIQQQKTEHAVLQEQLKHQKESMQARQSEYDSNIKRLYDEKNKAIDQTATSKMELSDANKRQIAEADRFADLLKKERQLQEQSESRWLTLLDQARTETKSNQKHYKIEVTHQRELTEKLRLTYTESQEKRMQQASLISQQEKTVKTITQKLERTEKDYHQSVTTIALLQEKINAIKKMEKKSVLE